MPPVGGWKTGVYCILNTVNGKRYIGSSSKSLKVRMRTHLNYLRSNNHYLKHLQNSWNKYGESVFSITVIERCKPESCLEREQYWIDYYQSFKIANGFNRSPTAKSNLGVKFPEQSKRLSKLFKGVPKSIEHRNKISESLKGRKISQKAKELISMHRKGKKLTESHKLAIGKATKKRYESAEFRLKMSNALKMAHAKRKSLRSTVGLERVDELFPELKEQ